MSLNKERDKKKEIRFKLSAILHLQKHPLAASNIHNFYKQKFISTAKANNHIILLQSIEIFRTV